MPPLVVVAASARALVECLRRAGLPEGGAPLLAVDAFGDDDLLAAVDGWQRLPLSCLGRPQRVRAAVDSVLRHFDDAHRDRSDASTGRSGDLPARAPRADLLIGGGFDGAPTVLKRLAERFRLLNSPRHAWLAARDPLLFQRLDVAAPETHLQPPVHSRGWLRKLTARSAGLGVMAAGAGASLASSNATDSDVVWQRRVAGTPVSLLFCAYAGGILPIGVNRQWCNAAPGMPFRFGGIASGFDPGPAATLKLLDAARRVVSATGLRGLASLDAILDRHGAVHALELNPRPTASIELYDRAAPGLMRLHIAAVLGEMLPPWMPPAGSRALALVYADTALPMQGRPRAASDWREGAVVRAGEPVCTLHAAGPDAAAAVRRARASAGRLRRRLHASVALAAPDTKVFLTMPAILVPDQTPRREHA